MCKGAQEGGSDRMGFWRQADLDSGGGWVVFEQEASAKGDPLIQQRIFLLPFAVLIRKGLKV